jgi:HlyD family secretion protein
MAIRGFHLFRVALICALIPLAFWPAHAQTDQTEALPTVTTATVKKHELRAVVQVSGTVVPKEEVYVTPQLNGVQIRQVLVDVGDWVNAGDTLVKLRRDLYESQLSQANAETARARSSVGQARNQITSTEVQLATAEAELLRVKRLFQSGSVSQASYDTVLVHTASSRAAAASAQHGLAIAQASEDVALAQLDIAELNLKWTVITSLVTGIVGKRNAKVGSLTAIGSAPLLTIFQGGALELSAEVIETALGSLAPGDGSTIEVAGIGPLIATVRMVAPTVNDFTRLGDVRITLENDKNMRAGLFGRGVIEIDKRMALALPVTAFLSDEDGTYVQTVEDGVVVRRAVIAGLIWQNLREVNEGLAGGETVIARAGAFFRDGDRVRVLETSAEDAR